MTDLGDKRSESFGIKIKQVGKFTKLVTEIMKASSKVDKKPYGKKIKNDRQSEQKMD